MVEDLPVPPSPSSQGGKVSADCSECALRRLPGFRGLPITELGALMAVKRRHLTLDAGQDLFRRGRAGSHLYILSDGWAVRYQRLRSGAEQILDFLLPGDSISHHAPFGWRGYAVRTLTPAMFCVLDAKSVGELLETHQALRTRVARARAEEQERLDRRLTLLGRMGATQRIGYLLLEVRRRLRQSGQGQGAVSEWPIERRELADASGLSRAHLMRALRDLRVRGLADLRGRRLTIPSERRLARFSEFTGGRARRGAREARA